MVLHRSPSAAAATEVVEHVASSVSGDGGVHVTARDVIGEHTDDEGVGGGGGGGGERDDGVGDLLPVVRSRRTKREHAVAAAAAAEDRSGVEAVGMRRSYSRRVLMRSTASALSSGVLCIRTETKVLGGVGRSEAGGGRGLSGKAG